MRDTSTMVNGFDMNSVDALDPELRQIVKRRASLLGPAYKLFYANPVRIVRGEGVHLYDADGQAIPGRLQQRAVGRALPPAGRGGDRPPGGHAQHAHQVRQPS